MKKHPSLCPAWRFWSRGEPSGRRRVPKQTRVGAPQTTFCLQGHHNRASATRDSTRTHSVPQPAATSFGKSIPLPAFLLLSLRDALRYQAWRGWQRTSGLAHARPPHGLPQPRRGGGAPTHPTAALHWRAPSKNWPGRVAPPDTFRGKISPVRRHRPRRGQPAIHTSTPPDPKARQISAPNTQLTNPPRRRQKQR